MSNDIYIRKEAAATLNIYDFTDQISDIYDVWLNGRKAVLSDAVASSVPYSSHWNGRQRPLNQTEHVSVLRFDSDERVNVRCVPKHSNVVQPLLRPLSGGGRVSLVDGGIEFTLTRPGYYALENNGAREALHIFYAPCRDFAVSQSGDGALWFGAGVHDVGEVRLFSNQTVYIAPDATVYGSFIAVNAENIRICGFGILDSSRQKRSKTSMQLPSGDGRPFDLSKPDEFLALRESLQCAKGGIQLYGCKNARVEGITLRDSALPAVSCVCCERVTIEHVKTVGMWRYASGGISFINSRDCALDSCFVRSFDDCVSVKGISGFDFMTCAGISVRRSMLWCEWGRSLMIGSETHSDEICDLLFEDCDLVHAAHAFIGILNRDRARIHHIEYKRIRAEYALAHKTPVYQSDTKADYRKPSEWEPPALADFTIYGDSLFGGGDENGTISDIVLKDIHLRTEDTQTASQFRIQGLDGRHDVKNIYIDGLFINGMRVRSFTKANIFVNAFASKVVFT